MKNKTQEELENYLYFRIVDRLKKKYGCEIGMDSSLSFTRSFVRMYQEAGYPKPVLKWIDENILPEFISMTEPPVWYERVGTNKWPFHEGKPMIFFGQFTSKLEGIDQSMCNISIMVFGYKECFPERDSFRLHLVTSYQHIDSEGESAEEHYRKEARRMRDQARRAKKKAAEDVKE